MELFDQFKSIKSMIFDVDGVLTDGSILVTEEGELLRSMNIKDGYAIKKAVREGIKVCIITGGKSLGVAKRLADLGVDYLYTAIEDKPAAFYDFLSASNSDAASTLYMGDDMPDLEVMKMCGMKTAPADAIHQIRTIADYTSPINGGHGCVRDVIEKVLTLQGKWS